MTTCAIDESQRKAARVAGLAYLITFATVVYVNFGIHERLIVGGNAGGSFTADNVSMDPLMHLTPGRFLITPGLWIGLAVFAACIAAAVRLRRYQGPI